MDKNRFLERAERHLIELDIPIQSRLKVLADLGEEIEKHPELTSQSVSQTVNKVLLAMDIPIPRKKASPLGMFLKFIFACFLLFALLLGIAFYKFSPIINISDDRIVLLGGLIDIDGGNGTFKVDSHYASNLDDGQVFKGSSNTIGKIAINAQNAQLKIGCSNASTFSWHCKTTKTVVGNFIDESNNILNFNLKKMKAVECQLEIPNEKSFELDANNINIALDRVCANIDIDADNGSVIIYENQNLQYNYDLEVDSGYIQNFNSDKSSNYKIKIELDNGTINKKI